MLRESESVPFSRGERLGERSCIKNPRSSAVYNPSSYLRKSAGNPPQLKINPRSSALYNPSSYQRKSAGNFSLNSNKIRAHLRFTIPQAIRVNLREILISNNIREICGKPNPKPIHFSFF
jgi:hypothetical protein